jgi:hypothetical protein
MLKLGLPHVNVLSKVDLLRQYDNLPFNLSFYTEMDDLTPMAKYVGRPMSRLHVVPTAADGELADDVPAPAPTKFQQKYQKMSEGICEVLSDLGLVHFQAMNVEDASTVGRVLGEVDRANGYSFASSEAEAVVKLQEETTGGPDGVKGASANHLFKLAADNLEPAFMRSLDIQERYTDPERDHADGRSAPEDVASRP